MTTRSVSVVGALGSLIFGFYLRLVSLLNSPCLIKASHIVEHPTQGRTVPLEREEQCTGEHVKMVVVLDVHQHLPSATHSGS